MQEYGSPRNGRRFTLQPGSDMSGVCVGESESAKSVNHECDISTTSVMNHFYVTGADVSVLFNAWKETLEVSGGLHFSWEQTLSGTGGCDTPETIQPGDCGSVYRCYAAEPYTERLARRATYVPTGQTIKRCRWVRSFWGWMNYVCEDVPIMEPVWCTPCKGGRAVAYIGINCHPVTSGTKPSHHPALRSACP